MKVLEAAQMEAADEATAKRVGIPSRVLMEVAGREVSSFILKMDGVCIGTRVVVLAGSGNNAGDGYVIARALDAAGLDVLVISVKPIASLKGDAASNASIWKDSGGGLRELSCVEELNSEVIHLLEKSDVIVDAMYGTGFRGKMTAWPAEFVEVVNHLVAQQSKPVVAVDIPSGVEASTGCVLGECIKATYTVALQCLKVGHALFPGTSACGDVFVADIGIPVELAEIGQVSRELITRDTVSYILQSQYVLSQDAHKGTRGHVLVVGGGAGHFGAPKMSARAALITGAGMVSMFLPSSGFKAMQAILMELMCVEAPEDDSGLFGKSAGGAVEAALKNKSAVVVGPGMGQSEGGKQLLLDILRDCACSKISLVIDADALNIIASDNTLLEKIPAGSVLTPHPAEMARLCKLSTTEVNNSRLEVAKRFSSKYKCWVVLKGARTIISGPSGEIFINPTATTALATAGAGDVLAGIIAAFLARGFCARDAAISGVFIHGSSGQLATAGFTDSVGVVASDVIELVPEVINELLRGVSSFGAVAGHSLHVLSC